MAESWGLTSRCRACGRDWAEVRGVPGSGAACDCTALLLGESWMHFVDSERQRQRLPQKVPIGVEEMQPQDLHVRRDLARHLIVEERVAEAIRRGVELARYLHCEPLQVGAEHAAEEVPHLRRAGGGGEERPRRRETVAHRDDRPKAGMPLDGSSEGVGTEELRRRHGEAPVPGGGGRRCREMEGGTNVWRPPLGEEVDGVGRVGEGGVAAYTVGAAGVGDRDAESCVGRGAEDLRRREGRAEVGEQLSVGDVEEA